MAPSLVFHFIANRLLNLELILNDHGNLEPLIEPSSTERSLIPEAASCVILLCLLNGVPEPVVTIKLAPAFAKICLPNNTGPL